MIKVYFPAGYAIGDDLKLESSKWVHPWRYIRQPKYNKRHRGYVIIGILFEHDSEHVMMFKLNFGVA